jgi:hypothetical protein
MASRLRYSNELMLARQGGEAPAFLEAVQRRPCIRDADLQDASRRQRAGEVANRPARLHEVLEYLFRVDVMELLPGDVVPVDHLNTAAPGVLNAGL